MNICIDHWMGKAVVLALELPCRNPLNSRLRLDKSGCKRGTAGTWSLTEILYT